MAVHALSNHFRSFFSRINPSPTWVSRASSQYTTIKGLIEDPYGRASILSPRCFLQGSYDRHTAIYTINDIDIVALCELWQPGSGGTSSRSWGRDEIFDTIAAPLLNDGRYSSKVRYGPTSMCIKVDLGISVEILPVVYKKGNDDYQKEPFRLFRPETGQWEDGFARLHQAWLSDKNRDARTQGNFIPVVKALKHMRTLMSLPAVSFHIECLLWSLDDRLFQGNVGDAIASVVGAVAGRSADDWYGKYLYTPCRDRDIFTDREWGRADWGAFHKCASMWARGAQLAVEAPTAASAVEAWQIILGDSFFPTTAA